MGEASLKRPLKIVLVYPSSRDSVQTLYTFNKNQRIGKKPPQSILILATYLRAHGFADTHCLDAQLDDLTPEQTVAKLKEMKPDVIGITAWTDFWYPVWKTLTLARQQIPNAVLIAGGPHTSIYPRETMEAAPVDYVVSGDGEDVLLNIVKSLSMEQPVQSEPGLWMRRNGEIVVPGAPLAVIKDLTTIPPPDRTLLPYKRYSSILTPSQFETTMVTSRGCPYKCVFCKMDVQKVYARSAAQVVEEFRQIAELGITDVQVYDDTFTWGKERALDICQGIIDAGIKVNWAIRDRVNRVTPELYSALKRAGCYRVHFGVETGSDRVLKASGKFITLDQVHQAMKVAKDVDMTTMTYFMFGFLDETMEDAQMTIDLAKKLEPDYISFGVLIPYPGTAIYREAMARGVVPRDYWQEYARNPTPNYRIPYVVEDKLDRETLIALKDKATRDFYINPQTIWREIKKLRSPAELLMKARLAYAILTAGISPFSVYRS